MASDLRIFVSYAREDIAAARRVYDALKNAGHIPWMDKVDLLPGQNWKVAIQEAIQNCRFFVALLSSRSVGRKGYAQTELSRALDELVGVLVDNTRIDGFWYSMQEVDGIWHGRMARWDFRR